MNKSSTTPKDVFLHLLMIVTLFISVINGITLIFQYINLAFPDSLNFYYRGILEAVRWSSASIIITFPVFLGTSWLIGKDIRKEPEKKNIGIRKWLIYLTLFVAAITIIVDLILLVFNFYGGELTSQFLLKLVTVLVITACVFGYYLWDLNTPQLNTKKNRYIALITSLVVLVSIVIGFFTIGSPAHQRSLRMDEERVQNLQWIQNEVTEYWRNKEKLPESLDALKNDISGFIPPTDPETGKEYQYKVIDTYTFKLCADFKAESLNRETVEVKPMYPERYPYGMEQNWSHGTGESCFERTIDPDFFTK